MPLVLLPYAKCRLNCRDTQRLWLFHYQRYPDTFGTICWKSVQGKGLRSLPKKTWSIYTHLYFDRISTKDPMKLKFLNETVVWLYGYSQVGKPCVNIQRYMANPNKTVNFLEDIDGIKYCILIDGTMNNIEFLHFF